MKNLLNAIAEDLALNLAYLKWVKVIDSENLVPDGLEFPGVGLRDGAQSFGSLPGKKDMEQLTVMVVPYQSLSLGTPGAAVMGDVNFKGVLDICAEIRARLNDNRFTAIFGEKIFYAHVDSFGASETLGTDEGIFIQMKRIPITYRRLS